MNVFSWGCSLFIFNLLSRAAFLAGKVWKQAGKAGAAGCMLSLTAWAGSWPLELPDTAPFDGVSWLCAHNAMSNSRDGWWCPNQNWNIPEQLKAGVHAQMWDVWKADGELVLRHGNGTWFFPGSISLHDALEHVRVYLERHPRAVLTLILESYADNAEVRKAFEKAGVAKYCALPPEGRNWPTLGEMRKTGRRLVVMTDRPDGEGNWPMPIWSYCVETPWKTASADRMPNMLNRGRPGNGLLIVNHFVSTPVPMIENARKTNVLDVLRRRSEALRLAYGRRVNFWVLDFVDTGEVVPFMREQNALGREP